MLILDPVPWYAYDAGKINCRPWMPALDASNTRTISAEGLRPCTELNNLL
jgi:hypothetical protein